LGLDGGGHLEHRPVAFDAEQRGHADTAGVRDTPDVVAQQIDDHEILGAILGVIAQALGPQTIDRIVAATRCGALHRPGAQHPVAIFDEQFRRARQHMARSFTRG
ncbi:hypothetical protein RZS08_43930, partial [Arthrospira platensis SPKY1]|nr:hypothetical protein [Arthrospira platensis SPKY1]